MYGYLMSIIINAKNLIFFIRKIIKKNTKGWLGDNELWAS